MSTKASIVKPLLLPLLVLSATGCRTNSGPVASSSELFKSSEAPMDSSPNAIINQLATGDDYHVEEFKAVFEAMPKPISASKGVTFSDYQNIMPHDYYDQYHIGAFRVKVTIGDDDPLCIYYLMYNQKLYDFSRIYPKADYSKPSASFLFADINKDNHIELTIAFYICSRLTVTYLATLDTASETYILASHSAYNSFLFFKEKDDGYQIYSKQVIAGEIQDSEVLFSDIIPYTRSFTFNQNEYDLKSDNYRVLVKKDEERTSITPLIYRGLTMRFAVKTSLTWLGETFSYTNGDNYLDGALATFTQGETKLKMEDWPVGPMITDFTIETNQVIDCTYYYLDEYDDYNPLGNYDMEISYREEIIIEKNALMITQ